MNLRSLSIACLLAMLASLAFATPQASAQTVVAVYVAPDGSVAGDGSITSPFQNPQDAVNLVVELHNATQDPSAHYVIRYAAGTYNLSERISVDAAAFNGTPPRITMEPLHEGQVLLSALKTLPTSLFTTPTDPTTTARIRPEVAGQIYEADLAAVGIPNLSQPPTRTGGVLFNFELFADGDVQPLSRFPNGETNMTMGLVLHNGSTAAGDGGIFTYNEHIDRHEVWADAVANGRQVWMRGFWRVVWFLDTLQIESIDKDARTVEFIEAPNLGIGSKYHRPGGSGAEPYWVENLLEEIDEPGEWAIDFTTQKLYLLPSAPLNQLDLHVSNIEDALLSVTDMANFAARGLDYTGARGFSVEVSGGQDNEISDCEIYQSLHGIRLENGARNRVIGCEIHDIGGTGIAVTGTEDPALDDSGHEIVNNHIHHYALKIPLYNPAVHVRGVGARVAHNLIHDSPHVGILLGGYNHLIEYNDISQWSQTSNDMGGIYSYLRADESGGFIVRHNYVHDSPAGDGIYFDQHDVDTQVYSNLVVNTYRAYLFKITRDHHIRDNIAIGSTVGFTVPMTEGTLYERNVSIDNDRPTQFNGANDQQNNATLVRPLADLAFADAGGHDYRIDPAAPIFDDAMAFSPIDFANVGISEDAARTPQPSGDVNCDDEANIIDALLISQFTVGTRTDAGQCPLGDQHTMLDLSRADVNADNFVDIIDALLIVQCDVGVTNLVCR